MNYLGIFGKWTISRLDKDGNIIESITHYNKLNRRLRQAVLQSLIQNLSSYNMMPNAIAFGQICDPPTDQDESMSTEFFRDNFQSHSPTNVPMEGDTVTWTYILEPNEHTTEWISGYYCGEIGIFNNAGQMISHVKINPTIQRDGVSTLKFDWSLTLSLNKITEVDEVSNGDIYGC